MSTYTVFYDSDPDEQGWVLRRPDGSTWFLHGHADGDDPAWCRTPTREALERALRAYYFCHAPAWVAAGYPEYALPSLPGAVLVYDPGRPLHGAILNTRGDGGWLRDTDGTEAYYVDPGVVVCGTCQRCGAHVLGQRVPGAVLTRGTCSHVGDHREPAAARAADPLVTRLANLFRAERPGELADMLECQECGLPVDLVAIEEFAGDHCGPTDPDDDAAWERFGEIVGKLRRALLDCDHANGECVGACREAGAHRAPNSHRQGGDDR